MGALTAASSVAILVPVLGRPHRVAPLLASIRAATTSPHRVLFIVDPEDVPEQDAVRAAGADMIVAAGSYARKINQGVAETSDPLIFLGADDLAFHPRWMPEARAKLVGDVRVVGTNDLGNPRVIAGQHATHCLVARSYAHLGTIDEPGHLLSERYRHNWVDQEFVETAKARGAWAFAKTSHVEHRHPHWQKGEMDDTYRTGLATYDLDRGVYERRRHLWT